MNASLEADSMCFGCVPTDWFVCRGSPDNVKFSQSYDFPEASNGNYYIALQAESIYPLQSQYNDESFGQFISCRLLANSNYFFYADLRSKLGFTGNDYWENGIMQVIGGVDSCDSSLLLWESHILDTEKWERYKVEFTPNIDITFVKFLAKMLDYKSSIDLIDNLSPIYCSNLNRIALSIPNDTSITKGECIALTASATAGYDSIYWQSIPAGFSAATLNAGEVCPAQSTTYIVAIRDTGCGSFWSYDTLRVEVTVPDAPILNGPDNNGTIQIISNDNGYLILYDLLGRTVHNIPIAAGIQTITLGNYHLSAAMYIAEIRAANKRTIKKLIWVK